MTTNSAGSLWHRWDPHIHTPATTIANQFGHATMADFCAAVEACDPVIEAVGITDYFSLRGYEEIVELKAQGRLPSVQLIFPNVEIRFGLGTTRGSAINAHLLFAPDDSDHIERIHGFLSRLTFVYSGDTYVCADRDLIRLGRKRNPELTDDRAARQEGVNQFKVDPKQLWKEFANSEWVRNNCLIGMAAGQNDGTSGLQTPDSSLDAIRTSIEAEAHLIFSGNPKDREFWLGNGTLTVGQVEAKYRNLKPCLHGSDAHELSKVGNPALRRLCWIKGDLTFESLRQACIEPAERAYLGEEGPTGASPSQTISSVSVSNAPWMLPSEIPLNPGMVAIIGARGSGKTALADFIAVGAHAIHGRNNDRSFIARAANFLDSSMATLTWGSGEKTADEAIDRWRDSSPSPRVQYLSQQFVDALCSSEGLADSLVGEVKRVIFNAHPIDLREGATDFEELYDIRCVEALEERQRSEAELDRVADELLQERQLKQELDPLAKHKGEVEASIQKDLADRTLLVRPGQEIRVKRHQEISAALLARRTALEQAQKSARALTQLRADLVNFRDREAPTFLAALKTKRADACLSDAEWETFIPTISREADTTVEHKLKSTAQASEQILGTPIDTLVAQESGTAFVSDTADLSTQTVSILQGEADRLGHLIGIDLQNAAKYKSLTAKIEASQRQLGTLTARIKRCNEADERIKELNKTRKSAYKAVFQAIVELESELTRLYAPLADSLGGSTGALARLQFVIRRSPNVRAWADDGEALLDLRKDGPFRGKGTLATAANQQLLPAWSTGTPEEAGEAVSKFILENADRIKIHRPEEADLREWNAKISAWLHSTKHIKVEYGLQYEGVDVERLSPGTRGIVLLLLYLAVDKQDDRPLVIDQPEENLDPQSVYDELVPRFRDARTRRQIIIVTHNANLVVNTDVDQVIVATAGEHTPGQLPNITYRSGGLENAEIRDQVCEILEGGARAFEARAKRLRVGLK